MQVQHRLPSVRTRATLFTNLQHLSLSFPILVVANEQGSSHFVCIRTRGGVDS